MTLYLFVFFIWIHYSCPPTGHGRAPQLHLKRQQLHNYTWFIHGCHVDLDNTLRRVALYLLLFVVMMENVWRYLLCCFTNLVYDINFYSSSFFLAYMTVERYLAVGRTGPRPWGPKQARLRGLLCGFLWVLSVVLGLLENAHVTLLEWDEPGCYIYLEHNFIDWNTTHTFLYLLIQFLGPAAIIVTFNLLTLRAVRARPEGAGRGKELWLVHLYSLVFVLCLLPLHIVLMLLLVDELNPRVLSCQTVEKIYFSYAVRGFRGNLNRRPGSPPAKELCNASTSQSDVDKLGLSA
uniref:G-protein coupled receptors family 1 profile domain-containing protein n=1 Tax=Hucho hucho TaxID=62062 RepID=A0A4W5KLC2_9TELE